MFDRECYVTKSGIMDVIRSLKEIRLPLLLAKYEIKQRYRRSTLGPFWITISTAVMISTIGFIFGRIFGTPLKEFLPFIAAGFIIWSFFSTSILEATDVFNSSEATIKQLPIPLFSYVLKLIIRNFYIFCHNIILYPLVCFVVGKSIGLPILLSIPGMFLMIVNLAWVALILGIVCTRYRDLKQIVGSIMQILFYVTPIIWMPNQVNARVSSIFIDMNPVFHILSVVRTPLLGQYPNVLNWGVSLLLAIIGWIIALLLFNCYRNRISYWL